MAAYQLALPKLDAEDVGVVSGSADLQADAEKLVSELKLTFPVAYGLDAEATAAATGAFFTEQPPPRGRFLMATAFVLNPDRKLVAGVYSTASVGRLPWQDALGLVKALKAEPR